jgi:hypothetical protein
VCRSASCWRSQQNENASLNQQVRLAHPVKSPHCSKKAFPGDGSLIHQGDDRQYEVGLSGLIGPFPTKRFAESVASKEVQNAAS